MFDDADFEVLRADQIALFEIRELHIPRGNPKCVTLKLRWAGESNTGWTAGSKNAKLTTRSDEEAARYFDDLAAKTVIVGWADVLDKDGKPMAYTPALGSELLAKVRDMKRADLAQRITYFATTPANFTAAPMDAGDLGNG
jgi:hypothetical protein